MQNFVRSTLEILEPLSRLIPEKPFPDEPCPSVFRPSRCPCCHIIVPHSYSFCARCGQALDWSSCLDDEIFLVLPVPVDQISELKRFFASKKFQALP